MNLDRELRRALRRREPPPGFEQRVLQAIHARERRSPLQAALSQVRRLLTPRVYAPALAAVAVLLFVTGQVREQRRQRALAEEAGQQAVYALELAASKLTYAQQKALEPRVIRLDQLEKR